MSEKRDPARSGPRGAGSAPPFAGFSDRALAFYEGLEADNSRAYWQDHRAVFEDDVKGPMLALLDALEPDFGPARLFRPNRDTRFSADKSPYKTQIGALVGDRPGLGYYVQLSARGLAAGGGFRSHSPAQTARLRAAVATDRPGAELVGLLDGLRAAGFVDRGEQVRTTPRGYPADHPRIATLRFKELMLIRSFGEPEWLGSARTLDEVRGTWERIRPLLDWVTAHVGTD
ncbi:hypothetical protein N865_04940 [Intrasporangium oryzae NRRL B-24470]|uniref:TIGR02453 family protein n=1 Tax=Intrasporangium oryzae NRRL B-24470 TaxID=1386089 RepID=W9GB35_9MICO|nr:DUF2461 domain-containing protein [Intrasporangium oryzae]EWT02442.1 hypothetical protein N865_04940 [Intrasporangium oryzae NRRL B-24470]